MTAVPFRYDSSSLGITPDTSAGPSDGLWKNFPIAAIREDPKRGRYDFYHPGMLPPHASTSGGAVSGALGPFVSYLHQTGGIAQPTGGTQGGEAVFSGTGDNQGAAIGAYIAKYQLSTSKGRLIFESRFRSSLIDDTKHGIFSGLLEGGAVASGVPMATDGTLADKNFVGFHRVEGDGDMLDVVYKADGQTQQTLIANAITLATATFVKAGMIYDPQQDDAHKLTFFKNGVPLTTYATRALMEAVTFPSDVMLDFVFAMINATASTPGNAGWAWTAIGQEF